MNRILPYLIKLSRTIPYLDTLSQIHSDFALGNQPNSSITSREPSNNQIRTRKTLTFVRQSESTTENALIFVSQSESSITSTESSANQNQVLCHRELSARAEDPSRLSARYSLSYYIGSSTPLPRQLCSNIYYSYVTKKSKWEFRIWREINNFFIHLFTHRTRPFRPSKNGPNLSEMEIKKLIHAPT